MILIGDGPQRARLESLVDQLALRDTVTMAGALTRAAVISELQQATVFALPVRTRLAGLNPEGLGLAALEAAACGLPVIMGDSGGAAETVRDGETGYLLAPDDHQAWAGRIAELLDDPARAWAMGRRGRGYVVERFGFAHARTTLRRALRL
jgi:phosphatidylinositol alpha-1,6-mannosyltransferase